MAITTIGTNGIADNIITGAKVALASQAAGDVMYYNGTDWIRVGIGTDGQVLTVNNAENAPGWEAAGGGTAVAGTTDNGILSFVNSGSTFAAEANLTFDGTNLTVGTGNVIIGTAGKGIDFSATSNASGTGVTMSNELLDDYEEGTWTPTLLDYDLNSNMSQAYSSRQGSYVKIGEVVFVWCMMNITSRGSMDTSDRSHIGGLPFTPVSSPTSLNGPLVFHSASGMNITAGNTPIGRISPGNTYVYLANWDTTGGTSNLLISELSDDCGITMSGYYR